MDQTLQRIFSSGSDNCSEVAEVDESNKLSQIYHRLHPLNGVGDDSIADPDYDPDSTHESTSQEDTSQDTDELIVSQSVKEVRPCVAEHTDNDHRCEIAVQCIISGS